METDLNDAIDGILREGPAAPWGISGTGFSAFRNGWPRAIVIAQPYAAPLPVGRYSEAAFHAVLVQTRVLLDDKISRVQDLLEGQGTATLLPPAAQDDEEALRAPFPFKRAAVEAGLGWIGTSSLLVTLEHGPRVRLGAVLLGRPLECTTPPATGSCGECHACADACPWHLITGTAWAPPVARDRLLDYRECNRQRSRYIASHGRKHECGRCLLACPVGRDDFGNAKGGIGSPGSETI